MSDAQEHLTGAEGIKKLAGLIQEIRICMLTTTAADGSIDSRPMATQKTEFNGTVWFLTRHESGKVHEVAHNSHVALLYSDPGNHKFVAAKGTAQVSQDKGKIHELWSPMFNAWFPQGEDDPQIAVLRVDITEAQYWEASSSKIVLGLKYLAAAVTHGAVPVGEQGKVTL